MTSMVTVVIMTRPLHIDPHGDQPSYVQLADALRDLITTGAIGPREPLPSITRMQQETGLSVGTIRRAVRVLADEGTVYVVPGRGTYAAP